MTRLDAIQEILEGCGMPHATALASSGTWPSLTFQETDAGDAERMLERESKKLQSQGWFFNTLTDFRIYRPTYYYSYATTDPVFTFGETITDGDGNTSQFNYVDTANDRVYVGNLSGTPDASPGTLTGSTSGVTKAATSSTAVTSSKIAADPLWLAVEPYEIENRKFSYTYDSTLAVNFLVDMNPDNDANPTTTTWANELLRVNAIKYLEFTTLPQNFAQYVVAQASVAFQRYKKGDKGEDGQLQQRLVVARAHWIAENSDNAKTNVLRTDEMLSFKGGRRGAGYGRW